MMTFCSPHKCLCGIILQIIMAKPAGGPKPKNSKNWDEDD